MSIDFLPQPVLILVGLSILGVIGLLIINYISNWYIARLNRRQLQADPKLQLRLRRKDTRVRVIVALLRVLFVVGIVIAAIYLLFPEKGALLWGTTLALAIVGFALQPYLRDVIAGIAMMSEDWFDIGDTVYIEPMQVGGVIEHFNLRSTQLRTLSGEKVMIHNSAIWSASIARRGIKQFRLDLFVKDLGKGRELVQQVASFLPTKQTHIVHGLEITEEENINQGMYRITCTCTTPSGREWIVEELTPKLFKEQDADKIIIHGPVTYNADPVAERRISQSILPQD